MLVATQTVTEPDTNFTTDVVRWYEFNTNGAAPTLVQQGSIAPGPGIATYNGQIAIDAAGDLGITYMQSSLTQFVSMYVTGQLHGAPAGTLLPAVEVQAGSLSQPDSFRTGDYSGIAVDPSNGLTFWAINQYYGPDINNIWNTWVASFQVSSPVVNDWYSVNVLAGNTLSLTTSTPGDASGQFVNNLSLFMNLYDPTGNLVASGIKLADGRNVKISYKALLTGQYKILVYNEVQANTAFPGGEYFLSVVNQPAAKGIVSGQVFLDNNGDGKIDGNDSFLDGWTVDLYDSQHNLVASQVTHDANPSDPNEPAGESGLFVFEGLAGGVYTVTEVAPAGWWITAPNPSGTYSITLPLNGTSSGLNFGNFQGVAISGTVYNDLNGDGTPESGDPGLAGWTVNLFSGGLLIGSMLTDSSGNYSFSDVGPGNDTIQEVTPSGWIVTQPVSPPYYAVTTSSGQSTTGLDFGNFQLVTITGEVFNDLNGNGALDPGDPGLSGWTVNLLDSGGNLLASETTPTDGSFSFSFLGPGLYTVQEVRKSGWFQTAPAAPGTFTVAATSGVAPHSTSATSSWFRSPATCSTT